MTGKVPKKRVQAVSQGDDRGVLVPVSRSQLEEAGLDPDAAIEVNRCVYDTDRAEMRLRFYEAEDDSGNGTG